MSVAPVARGPSGRQPPAMRSRNTAENSVAIHLGRVESLYGRWPRPVCIVSDGPYGVSGYPGDLHSHEGLAEWYEPHVKAWSELATPETTLWFWNSEIGWATVHPLLAKHGWEYRSCHIWDKGLGHVAGNSNTKTLRKFPVTTEACVQYVREVRFGAQTMQGWLRSEWKRTGLPFSAANAACGVANAASRKYLSPDHLWYFPPPDAFARLAAYANKHGDGRGRPYFSANGSTPITADEWGRYRAKFRCAAGWTNVWRQPHVGGTERVNGRRKAMRWKFSSLHGSQKPLNLIELTILSCTDPGDVVWEPFGGLCPAAVCSYRNGRTCRSAEIVPEFYAAAVERLENAPDSRVGRA